MRELLELGWGIRGIFGMTGIGVIVRVLLLGYYGLLGNACGHFEDTGNKTIVYIREDLKKRAERRQEIKNVLTYTEYRLAERRICGFRIGSLEGMVAYSMLLTGVSCILFSAAGVFSECRTETMLELLFAGGVSMTGLIILDVVTGLREKKKRVRLRLRDYIENSWIGWKENEGGEDRKTEETELRTEKNEKTEKEIIREKKRQKKENKLKEKDMKKRSADKPKKSGKKHGKAQEEKRRLTEELLRERRLLEAKSLAEQRRKERAEAAEAEEQAEAVSATNAEKQVQRDAAQEECSVVQVMEEAAVAECPEEQTEVTVTKSPELSYEELLNEFLKEYSA